MPAGSGALSVIRIVWRFVVKPECVAEFEKHYDNHGTWANLFAKAEGYRGTEMLRRKGEEGEYLVIDQWDSEEHF
ncbi:MAG: hypothetical protein NVS9B15_15100 [Acidobacteriaceae bacterium]